MTTPSPYTRPKNEGQDVLQDPEEARIYLDRVIQKYRQDEDVEPFLLALRQIADAQGGIGALARRIDLNRQHLYRALSEEGNPQLRTVGQILRGLGFRLSVAVVNADDQAESTCP